MRLQTRFSRRLSAWLSNDRIFASAALAILAVIEVLGRTASSDLGDGVGVVVLLVLATTVVLRQRRSVPEWLRRVGGSFRRLGAVLARVWLNLEVDLRRDPPLERRVPPAQLFTVIGGLVMVAAAAAVSRWMPVGLRDALADVFYLGYLVVLGALWTVLIAGIGCGGLLPMVFIMMAFDGYLVPKTRAVLGLHLCIQAGYMLLIVALAVTLPASAALVVIVALLGLDVVLLVWPRRPRLDLVWWSGEDDTPRVVDWSWSDFAQSAVILAIVCAAGLLGSGTTLGEGLAGPMLETMPVTASLSHVFWWTSAAAYAAVAIQSLRMFVLRLRRDPCRRHPMTLHVGGADSRGLREEVARLAASQGWRVRFSPRAPRTVDVRVEIDPGGVSMTQAPDPAWPLRLTPAQLGEAEVRQRLRRRDQIQRRRLFFRGLERLFKAASTYDFDGGEGYWLAPHQWFATGLTRDGDEDSLEGELEVVGPPFHRLFPREVSGHLHEVLAALEIDLIFVEDGVGFRRLRRVMRHLFDFHDMFGGERKLEERHLTGITGVRALVIDYSFESPFESSRYPEPDYRYVGRARILHVFRDRGEDESPVEAPTDAGSRPLAPLRV